MFPTDILKEGPANAYNFLGFLQDCRSYNSFGGSSQLNGYVFNGYPRLSVAARCGRSQYRLIFVDIYYISTIIYSGYIMDI